MKRQLLVPAALILTALGGCSAADDGTENLGVALDPALVSTVGQACVAPMTNLGEYLGTDTGDTLEEWGASIDAMPAGATKTDLQARLLNSLEGPATAFPNATDQANFLRNFRTPVALGLPFDTAQANPPGLWQGWQYNGGGSHRGHDFGRSGNGGDPSFEVRAVAEGIVIGVYFDGPGGGGGNTVVIEHTGSNGKKIYSFYMHMRNGLTHDRNAIAGIDCSKTGDPTSCGYYKLAAVKNPPAAFWGSESDTIVVTPGQYVTRGQKLGMSGNMMTAMGYINSNGDPTTADVNNHLHVYIGAPMDSDPKRAVEVDGYGVYGQASTGCYSNVATNTYYPRLFAPFLPEFYDTTFTNFAADPYYYDGMSFLPQTLSVYSKSGVTNVAGSYQYSSVGGYYVKVGDNGTGLYDGVNQAWIPRETRVRVDANGNASYDAVIKPRGASESTAYWHKLTQAQLDSVYNTYVITNGYSIGDFFAYKQSGVQYYSVLFTTDTPASNWLIYSATAAQASSAVSSMPAGVMTAQVVADETWSPPKFSVLGADAAGCTPHVYVDQSMSIYASKLAAEQALGYKLMKVQVYAGGTKFNAVFHRYPFFGFGCAAHP